MIEPLNEFLTIVQKALHVLFGTADGLLYALIVLVVLDYITGVCVAIHDKKLSSEIGAKGISKKVMIFALVALSHIVDESIMQSKDVMRVVTTTFYLANEAISILENAGRVGVPLPEKLKECIEQIKNKSVK